MNDALVLIDSTYRILQLSGKRLQILDPGDYLFGLVFCVFGLVPTLFFIYRVCKSCSFFPAWGILIWGLPFLVVGLLACRGGTLTLDRNANTAIFHRPVLLWHSDTVVFLDSLNHAEILSMSASDYIAVVLNNGDALTFADSTQQGGKGRAVAAINRYLGSTGK